jgi:ATP-dependent helicase/nuclease subunit A
LPGKNQISQGVIDVCYRINGRVVVADYKTDQVGEKKSLTAAAKKYQDQKDIYTRAIKQTLGEKKTVFKVIFLRAGEAVEM